MERINKSLPNSFITLGVVFLIIGFIQQEFSINFESGFFTLGLFFVVGGLTALFLNKRNKNFSTVHLEFRPVNRPLMVPNEWIYPDISGGSS